jgi:hypothetical protein
MTPSPADLNRGIGLAHDALARRLTRVEEVHATALRSLGAMVAEDLSHRGDSLTAAAWTAAEPEALTAELRRRLDESWVGRHTGAIERVRAEALRVTMAEIGAALGVAFDLANPVLAGVLRSVRNRTDLSSSAWDLVRDSLQASYDTGASIPQAARDIRTKVAAVAPVRARTIARTELVAIANAGSVAAARLSGAAEWKTWLATNDARTRQAHANAAGQTRRIDDTFAVGGDELDYPGDPSGSAGNVIACRCSVVMADGPEGYDGPLGSSALLASVGCGACGGSH